ncbi:MAG TPA: hypothetical protein VHC69_22860 [Polyangiaceae bacterium]|nr:hypothetical protein [Polyangiaceae bacterium]
MPEDPKAPSSAELAFEDRALVALRADKGLSFREIAYFLCGTGLDAASADREATWLRERFRLLQKRLRRLSHEQRSSSFSLALWRSRAKLRALWKPSTRAT